MGIQRLVDHLRVILNPETHLFGLHVDLTIDKHTRCFAVGGANGFEDGGDLCYDAVATGNTSPVERGFIP